MAQLFVLLGLVCLFRCSNADYVSHIVMDCPANQILVQNVPTVGMMTCGRYLGTSDPGEITPHFTVVNASAELPFACRCPPTRPYVADDGYTCLSARHCERRGPFYRHCPANQITGGTAHGEYARTCYAPNAFYGDILFPAECGCSDGLLDVDGQTCVPRSHCPPMCHGDQVLNLLSGKDCTATCADPEPICSSQNVSRCECPADKPLLAADGVSCITRDECAEQPVYTAPPGQDGCPPTQALTLLFTPFWDDSQDGVELCRDTCSVNWFSFYDGCFGEPEVGCGCVEGMVMNSTRGCVRQEECPQACFGGDQQWAVCGSTCVRTCANPDIECDDSICVPRCQCPADRPYLLNKTTCVSREGCSQQPTTTTQEPQCHGNMVHTECGNCPQSCPNAAHPIMCLAACMPGCACPPDSPFTLDNGRCGTLAECYSCGGDLEFSECGYCNRTCENPDPLCTRECRIGCFCPHNRPISLGGVRCGLTENCTVCTPFDVHYDNERSFKVKLTNVEDQNGLDHTRVLAGHPEDSPLVVMLAAGSRVKLDVTLKNNAVTTTMNVGELCVETKNIKKIKLQYFTNTGKIKWSEKVEGDVTCLGDHTDDVTRIRMFFQRKGSKTRLTIGNLNAEACYD